MSKTIKFKKLHHNAEMPSKAYPSDTGYDIKSIGFTIGENYIEYQTGIAVSLPEGYGLQIRPRSSISKKDLILCNGPGTLDTNYTGEILIRFKLSRDQISLSPTPIIYGVGDKIAQLVIEKVEQDFLWEEVEELPKTDRGAGGFGSTDKKVYKKE